MSDKVKRYESRVQLQRPNLTSSSKDTATNPRGIPYAPFVDKVEDYVSSRAEVDGTMRSFQEMISYVLRPQPSVGGPDSS